MRWSRTNIVPCLWALISRPGFRQAGGFLTSAGKDCACSPLGPRHQRRLSRSPPPHPPVCAAATRSWPCRSHQGVTWLAEPPSLGVRVLGACRSRAMWSLMYLHRFYGNCRHLILVFSFCGVFFLPLSLAPSSSNRDFRLFQQD